MPMSAITHKISMSISKREFQSHPFVLLASDHCEFVEAGGRAPLTHMLSIWDAYSSAERESLCRFGIIKLVARAEM